MHSSTTCAYKVKMSSTNQAFPSLCIPRVFANITKERVAYVFNALGLGEIDHIDMVKRVNEETGQTFQRVFVHFKSWAHTEEAQRARKRVSEGKEIKIVYDDPWFWKISMNRSAPHSAKVPRQQGSKVPRLELSDDEEQNQQSKTAFQQTALFPPLPAREDDEDVLEPSTPRYPPPPLLSRSFSNDVEQEQEQEQEQEGGAGLALNYGEAALAKIPAKRVRVSKKVGTGGASGVAV